LTCHRESFDHFKPSIIFFKTAGAVANYHNQVKLVQIHETHFTTFLLIIYFKPFPIQRCTRFRFGPLLAPQILPRLKFVAEQEEVKLTEDGEKALMALSGGDMRKVSLRNFNCHLM
jgi:hypothetical protein